MKRILITGSRSWVRTDTIAKAIDLVVDYLGTDVIVVHGAARGADSLAGNYARSIGLTVEEHPADWERYSKRAGYIRNAEMVALDADVCLAFIIDNSPGATMMVKLVTDKKIPLTIYREFTGS